MSDTPEPRFARIAAVIGDPTRARMLSHLLGGGMATAGELASAVGITPQTASTHLAKLVDADLVGVRSQGRHRYFKLASSDIAHALEALSVVAEAGETTAHRGVWTRPDHQPLREARTCYGHLAGRLGVGLHDALLASESLHNAHGGFQLDDERHAWFDSIGFDPHTVRASGSRGIVYPCVDWSERRDHFAGPLAVALLEHFLARHWLARVAQSRALSMTPKGRQMLEPLLRSHAPH
jgi:DNA-binding transcriptional ArsR family regulator